MDNPTETNTFQVGDIVKTTRGPDRYKVTAIGGGRLGNLVAIKAVKSGVERELYYYSLILVSRRSN